MSALTYTGELVVETCWCGMRHAVPRELLEHMRAQHRDGDKQDGIYCPLGHSWIISGEGEAARLRERLAAAQTELVAVRDQLAASEREQKRIAKRTAAGVCPCCNRSFVQLARHMRSQHPDYEASP